MFSGGAEIVVTPDAAEVRRLLSEDKVTHHEPFTRFATGKGGGEVFVAASEVAYVQQHGRPGNASDS